MNRWQEIWRGRRLDPAHGSLLARLMAADGFDALGKIDEAAWRAYVHRMAARLGLAAGQSVFEVGCGAGAFLYPLYERGHPVGGVDYAENLVRVARAAMPGARIGVADAARIDAEEPFDVVVANGVFLYFPDYAYAATTLQRMVRKARGAIGILDIPDLATREAAIHAREQAVGAAAYARRYADLPHLYFAREWFARTVATVPCTIRIEEQRIAGYLHNRFRYNVFIYLHA